jgi:hypothetical protein
MTIVRNLIDAELSQEDENLVIQKINETEVLLPFLENLSPEERQSLPKMGKKGLDFVERALRYGQEHRPLQIPYVDLDQMKRDLTLKKQVQRILGVLEPFCEKLKDSDIILGAESYAAARVIYNAAKGAAKSGVPGMDTIVKDLSDMYKRQYTSPGESGTTNTSQT